jgi:hypothetical protein
MKPGDTFLSMDLASGGHLTHGAKPNQSGKWFNPVHYEVTKDTNTVDYDQILKLAKLHKPKLIIAGGSAIPRILDFKKFRDICDEVGAYLLVDMAHISGLVAGGVHPNPLEPLQGQQLHQLSLLQNLCTVLEVCIAPLSLLVPHLPKMLTFYRSYLSHKVLFKCYR